MKNYFTKTVSLLIISFFIQTNISASHFTGSEITYTCLGGNTYQISLSLYRDCSGIAVPSTANVSFNCTLNSVFNFTAVLQKIPGTGQEITPMCSSDSSTCNGGTNYGVQEYVYQTQVTLVPCNQWIMTHSGCCRNPITTTSGAGAFYLIAELNNLAAPCNSSPKFSNKPVSIVCNGQPVCYNPAAIDLDGDSLVYSFFAPKTSATASINYLTGYSYTNFLNSSTPITINPQIGDICFTPTTNLTTAAGIKVEEWREINGTPTLIGTIYRDIQLKVYSCGNNIPKLSGMDLLNTHTFNPNDTIYSMEVCIGDIIDFDIAGFDADTFNSAIPGHPEIFNIGWNQGIPVASFQTFYNGTDSAYAHFHWETGAYSLQHTNYSFTATISDEACAYNGIFTKSYIFKFKGVNVDLGPDVVIPTNQTLTLSLPAGFNNYYWNTGDTSQTIVIDNSYAWKNEIIGALPSQNVCKSSDTVIIFIGSVGMADNHKSDLKVKIYPNPVGKSFSIMLSEAQGKSEISVYDATGKLMFTDEFRGKYYETKKVKNLSQGVYFVVIQNKKGNSRLQFIKE